jgi:hypothetical protein
MSRANAASRFEGPTQCEPAPLRLDPDTIDAIARRVAKLLTPRLEPPARTPRLLSASEVAEWWGVERSWVYEHAHQLGARRLGTGQRPRLRFDPDEVAERLAALQEERTSGSVPPDPRSTRFRARAELWSKRNRNRPGGAPTPPATAPKTRPSTR